MTNWIKRFDEKFPNGEQHFCGCNDGDVIGLWADGKAQLLAFFTEERQRVIDALRLDHSPSRTSNPTADLYIPYNEGWDAAVDELNCRIEELEK